MTNGIGSIRNFFRSRGFTQQWQAPHSIREEPMIRTTLKWLAPVFLTGLLIAAPSLFAQNQAENESAPAASKADRQEDRQALQQERQQIQQDRQALQSDVQQYGAHSPQARADRNLLKRDKRTYKLQARDLQRDRRQARHRRWVRSHRGI